MKTINKKKQMVAEINLKIQNELESFVKADENVVTHLRQRNDECLNNQKYIKQDEQFSLGKMHKRYESYYPESLGKPLFTDAQDLDYLKYRQN